MGTKYYNVAVKSKNWDAFETPLSKYWSGTCIPTGFTDLKVPKQSLNKVKKYFRNRKIKITVEDW